MDIAGYVSVSVPLSSGHTLQGNNKNNEGKQHRKNSNGNHAEYDHVKKGRKKSNKAESFKHMKINILHT
jgi:hypothetical protein